jgi:FkbM family methyltransferase
MYRFLFRIFNWMANFFVCSNNLGLYTAIRIFIVYRWRNIGFKCYLKFFHRLWYMRGLADFGVMHQFWYENYKITESRINPIRWIIDAGANIGDSTLRFHHFHPQAQIIALEPETNNADFLCRNLQTLDRVNIERKGLWRQSGYLHLQDRGAAMSYALTDHGTGESIPVTTVENLCQKYGIDRIGILKLDIEGVEREIFAHSANWIHLCDCIVWELNDHQCPGALQMLIQQIGDLCFSFTIIGEYLIGIRDGSGLSVSKYRFLS